MPIDDNQTAFNDNQWRRLMHTIREGKCVLLTGPDAAVPDGGFGTLTEMLAQQLSAEIEDKNVPDPTDLQHVAQRYLYDKDVFYLRDTIDAFYKSASSKSCPFHEQIARLPFALIIQTTHDRYLAAAYSTIGKKPHEVFYNFRGGQGGFLSTPNVDNPMIYGLFGHLDVPDSLVVAENDLLEFLTRVIKKSPPLHSVIEERFADPMTTYLFVGFGFQSWYLRILLRALRESVISNRSLSSSLALESDPFFRHPDHPKTIAFFSEEHRIDFSHISWTEFAMELVRRFDDEAAADPTTRLERKHAFGIPASDAPKVFLCYDRDDSDSVDEVEETIRANGLKVWRDLREIHAGDNWNRKIKIALEKQDYIVLLHSESFAVGRGYVNREIRIALDINLDMPQQWRHIIPCHFLGCSKQHEDLAHIQYLTLDDSKDYRRLADTIWEDWAARKDEVKQ